MILFKDSAFVNNSKRRVFGTLLLLATASCCNPCPEWVGDSAVGSPGSANSARLFLSPSNDLTGLELDFVQMKDGLRLYLNVFGLEIPPEPNDPDSSRVFISFREYSYHFSAARFQGGQRLLIPEYVQNEIIDFLQEGRPVFIQVGRYESTIYPDKFLDLFYRMVNTSL